MIMISRNAQSTTRLMTIWGAGAKNSVEELKEAVKVLVDEYFVEGDLDEALNCVRELHYMATLLADMLEYNLELSAREQYVKENIPTVLIVDAKSLYDLLVSPSDGGKDREACVDVVMIRAALEAFGTQVR